VWVQDDVDAECHGDSGCVDDASLNVAEGSTASFSGTGMCLGSVSSRNGLVEQRPNNNNAYTTVTIAQGAGDGFVLGTAAGTFKVCFAPVSMDNTVYDSSNSYEIFRANGDKLTTAWPSFALSALPGIGPTGGFVSIILSGGLGLESVTTAGTQIVADRWGGERWHISTATDHGPHQTGDCDQANTLQLIDFPASPYETIPAPGTELSGYGGFSAAVDGKAQSNMGVRFPEPGTYTLCYRINGVTNADQAAISLGTIDVLPTDLTSTILMFYNHPTLTTAKALPKCV
jgi:hypothetical protein